MIRGALYLSFLLFFHVFANGQERNSKVTEIDSAIAEIDSREQNAENIGHFVTRKFSDSDTTMLKDHYILDTIKRDFYKCIYDCTFRGLEKITFYFIDRQLIRVDVNVQEYNEDFFDATYYFDKGRKIYAREKQMKDSNLLWSLDRIQLHSKKYLNDVDGIITYLNNRKGK